jgi:hypothetical protein
VHLDASGRIDRPDDLSHPATIRRPAHCASLRPGEAQVAAR